jgi:hypothetical protein
VEPSPKQDGNDFQMAEVNHYINSFNHKKPNYANFIESLQEDIKRLYVDPTTMPAQRILKVP